MKWRYVAAFVAGAAVAKGVAWLQRPAEIDALQRELAGFDSL